MIPRMVDTGGYMTTTALTAAVFVTVLDRLVEATPGDIRVQSFRLADPPPIIISMTKTSVRASVPGIDNDGAVMRGSRHMEVGIGNANEQRRV
jgi:hypothetical protein